MFYLLQEVQIGEINMLIKFLYQLPHIVNNPTLKNEFDNDLRNLKEKYAKEMKSLMTYYNHE